MQRLFGILLFVIVCASTSLGQVPYFQNYFLLRKNEPVQVNKIFQDKTGFMWYATNKGLFRFDGISTQRFTISDSLPNDNVTAIAEDSTGRIWIGCKKGEIAYLEKSVVHRFEAPEGNSSSEISDMIFDQHGNLWFSTLGDGLYYFTQSRLYRLDEDEKMPDMFIYDLTLDEHGNVWAGTDGGIAICTLTDKSTFVKTLNYVNGLPDNIVRKIHTSNDGTMWIGTQDAGVIHYDPKSAKYTTLLSKWTFGAVTDFVVSKNKVWVSCLQNGLLVYDRQKKCSRFYDANTNSELTGINTLYKDYEGNIWAGSKSEVLRTTGDYIDYIESFGTSKNANVVALGIDKQDNLWFSNNEGLFKCNKNNYSKEFFVKQLTNTAFEKSALISLFIDDAGYIWAGLFGDGLIRLDPRSGKIKHLKQELKDGNILNISGKENEIWLATLGGVTRIQTFGEKLIIKNYNRSSGLNSDYIYQVFTDSKNRTWFATDGKGVDMLDQEGFHHYKDGLNAKVVYGFTEDGNHTIWANVQGEGIYKFDGKGFKATGSSTLFRNNNINSLTTDESGNIVVMHDLGIDVYDIRKNEIHSLGDEAGIQEKLPNLNAVAKDSHNRIYFGTDHGIVIYSDIVNQEISSPVPQLDGLKVSGKKTETTGNLNFRHSENDITINYAGIWFQNPENLNFRYLLENYDKDWISSKNHSVTYSSLPPGTYTFRLQVTDQTEFRKAKQTVLQFTIKPPFWQTPGFYFISAAFCIILGFGFVRYRERKLQRDNRILELKNAELKKTNMELDKFVYSVSHDLRAPLSSMLGVVEISEGETNEPLMQEHLGYLKESINKLDGFIKDILDYSRNARLEIRKEEIDFKQILKEITGNLKYAGGQNRKVEIQLNINNTIPFLSDKARINVMLNNLISNSIRYQDPTKDIPIVNIKVETFEDEATIVIQDNGIGISKSHHEKIFEIFYRVSESSVGSGLGLYIVKETVEKLHGNIQVESEPGIGTAINIHIPNNFLN